VTSLHEPQFESWKIQDRFLVCKLTDHPLYIGCCVPGSNCLGTEDEKFKNEWSCNSTPNIQICVLYCGSGYSDWLWAERSGDRILLGARFSALIQTGPGAHPASYTMGAGSFPGIKRPGRGVSHPPHLAPWLKKE
jgi:hypothetical protein